MYDLAGNSLWESEMDARANVVETVEWDGKDYLGNTVPNGPYIFFLVSKGKVLGKGKVVVMK